MADVAWYDQQIPPEIHRRESIQAWKISLGFASVFAILLVSVNVIGWLVFGWRIGSFEIGIAIFLPASIVVFGIVIQPRRPRYATKVGISASGVALRFADGGSADLPWESMSSVVCFKKEDFYDVIDVCSLGYEDEEGRGRNVLLLPEPGRIIQREIWRREFRKQQVSLDPVDRAGFSDADYASPPWAVDGLAASYLEGETREWYRIAVRGTDVVLQTRTDWDPEFVRLKKELDDLGFDDPAAHEVWMEVEREWAEVPIQKWQEAHYGDFFINPRRDPARQWVGEEPVRPVGRDSVVAVGARRNALRFDASIEEDCVCVNFVKTGPESFLAAMFVRGLGGPLRPGTCPECQGGRLARRSCVKCRGSGKHERCRGTGTVRYETRTWYEEGTGVLLRWETWAEGKLSGTRELQSLEPDGMPRA